MNNFPKEWKAPTTSQLLIRQILKSCTTNISERHEHTGLIINVKKIHYVQAFSEPSCTYGAATRDNKAFKCKQMGTYLTETKAVYKGFSVLLHSSVEVAKGWRSCGVDELVEHRLWGWFCWVPPHRWDAQAVLGATWAAVGWPVLRSLLQGRQKKAIHNPWKSGLSLSHPKGPWSSSESYARIWLIHSSRWEHSIPLPSYI